MMKIPKVTRNNRLTHRSSRLLTQFNFCYRVWKSTGNKNILTAQSVQHLYINYLKLLYDIVLIFLSNLFLQISLTIKDMLSGVGGVLCSS